MKQAITVAEGFDPVPSIAALKNLLVDAAGAAPAGVDLTGVLVAAGGEASASFGLDAAMVSSAGFTGKVGTTLLVPRAEGPLVLVGIGDPAKADASVIHRAAAALVSALPSSAALAVHVDVAGLDDLGQVAVELVEGIVLTRYSFGPLKKDDPTVPLTAITLVTAGDLDALSAGATRGRWLAAAGALSRDLSNCPPAHLNATDFADIAEASAEAWGVTVEVFDEVALAEMGCGGILGVNGGSSEPARMVKLSYRPSGVDDCPHLTLVGKGITYDSGGISLKPGDAVHATMKNDMSGAGAVLAAMSALEGLGCPNAVTTYLMCTDNMPSGTAMKLGDVLTTRGGTTVEVINTDAEGRLILSDGLVLAAEEPTDAIVDVATLTGSCMRALGTQVAGVMGNNQALIDQLSAAGDRTDEPLWQLPLEQRYRYELESDIADLKNLGGPNAGAIHAALFLAEFVGDVPWAHVDIAGTAQADGQVSWHTKGCTGFGARLVVDFAMAFTKP